MWYTVLTTLLLLFLCLASAAADPLTLEWDDEPDAQVYGYMLLMWSQPGVRPRHFDRGLRQYVSFQDLPDGHYTFAVYSYGLDEYGYEGQISELSKELVVRIPLQR